MTKAMTATEATAWLRERCEDVGIKPRPDGRIGQSVLVEMLSQVGYAIGPGTFSELERKGYFKTPGTGVWTGEEVASLVKCLNSLRRWKPGPNHFDEMKPDILRMVESGDESALESLKDNPIELLLLQITENDDRSMRETLREAIIRRMNSVGFIEE